MPFTTRCMNTNRLHFSILKSVLLLTTIVFSTATFAQTRVGKDSVRIAIEPDFDSVGKGHRFFFGQSYRREWATPVTIKIFDFAKEKGGLKIVEKGGGRQTKSLRLQDSTGQQWVIRTVQKYPENVLPETLRPTIAATIIKDQISAEHPFAALVVPPLEQTLGISHSHPKIVYVGDDAGLGKYREEFKNNVYLFEEREPTDADKTDNTDKAQKKLEKDNDNRVDEKMILRTRLLDMLLGDWDRHGDQWRWKQNEDSTGTAYTPIPRDRDQVFYNSSGVIPTLVAYNDDFVKFQNYADHIRGINIWNKNNQDFDRYFLTGLNEQDWIREIDIVQKTLTDKLIRDAIKQMPPDIYKISGPRITRNLIERRNRLRTQALHYYRFLSRTVEILGTAKNEHFDITNEANGFVHVKVNKIKKNGNLDQVIYDRTFDPKITHDLRIFAFAGQDVFDMHGSSPSAIKVRMIGGDDVDVFNADPDIKSTGNRYVYDRSDQRNTYPNSNQAKLKISSDTIVNYYKRKYFKYNYLQPIPLASYSRDYGFQLIGEAIFEKQGFRKYPYASRQVFLVNYGFGNNSLLLNYRGEFKEVAGKNDLVINASSKGPNYKYTFFGVGNESAYANDKGRNVQYYRNTYDYLDGDIGLRHTYNNWTVTAGLTAQYYNGEGDKNQAKFIKLYNDANPDQDVFGTKIYGGAKLNFDYDTRDKSVIPHRGVHWNTTIMGITGLKENEHSYAQIRTEFSFFFTPPSDSTFVIADRIGGGTTLGNAEYFQQLTLGGAASLRGFYAQRFTGKSSVYNNLEVRLKLIDFASYILPGTLGAVGFNDVGRVFVPGEKSNVIHVGYGGGFYFAPAQLILLEGLVGFSKDGAYPYVSIGVKF